MSVEPLRLPFPLLLAERYLRSTRRDAFVTVLAGLATCGIAIGSAALVLVLAALSGLQAFLREDVLERTPHIAITLPDSIEGSLMTRLADASGVRAVHRVVEGRGWILVAGTPRTIDLVGVDRTAGGLPHIFPDPQPVSDGSVSERAGLWLGSASSAAWGLVGGEVLELVSPRPSLSPFGPVPRVVRVRYAGSFRTGRTEQPDQLRAAIPVAAAERLFGTRASRLLIEADDHAAALDLAPRLASMVPEGSRLETWRDLNRPLFFALRLERSVMFLSVFLIIPVAAMALVTSLALLVAAKRSEIGMLRAMGARATDVRRAFGYLGGAVGVLGVVTGVAAGSVAAIVLDRLRLISPPGNVYFVDHLPFRLELGDIATVAGAAASMALLATLWAARRAARLKPVEVMNR